MAKRLYILGPMSNWSVHPVAFDEAQKEFENAGYDVVNPRHIDMEQYFMPGPGETIGYKHQIRADLHEMLICDGIAMLTIHVPSEGCARELHLAFDLDIPVKTIDQWINPDKRSA